MAISAKKFSEKWDLSYKTVLRALERGYYGQTERDGQGRHLLPEDMPLHYRTNGKTQRDSALALQLLDAADLGQVVHHRMFPQVGQFRYDRLLCAMTEAGLLEVRRLSTGATQLLSTSAGRACMEKSPKERARLVDALLKALELGLRGLQLATALLPLLGQLPQAG